MEQEAVTNTNNNEINENSNPQHINIINPQPTNELTTINETNTEPISNNADNTIKTCMDNCEKEEINYQKRRLPRYSEEIDDWISQTTLPIPENFLPLLEEEKIQDLKELFPTFLKGDATKQEEDSII